MIKRQTYNTAIPTCRNVRSQIRTFLENHHPASIMETDRIRKAPAILEEADMFKNAEWDDPEGVDARDEFAENPSRHSRCVAESVWEWLLASVLFVIGIHVFIPVLVKRVISVLISKHGWVRKKHGYNQQNPCNGAQSAVNQIASRRAAKTL